MNVIQRFPKWMFEEQFELHYNPATTPACGIILFTMLKGKHLRCAGYGTSIAKAAQMALEHKQDAVKRKRP